nr:60S ribosomal protein L19 [Hymenolepis microstoma]
MGHLKLVFLVVLALSLDVLGAPTATKSGRVEVKCISDYRQHCRGKPSGLTFNDGCRECKCEKGAVLCRKGDCTSFAKSEDDVFDYCDSINQKNAQRLEKKIKEASKPVPQPHTATKIDIDAAKAGELTESERAEAAARIQKHFENFLSGVITETETPPYEENLEDPSITVKRRQENISPSPILQSSFSENEKEPEPSTLKIQNIETFKDESDRKDRNLHRTPSRRRFGAPSRNRFYEYSNWPGILRTHGSPNYRKNRWSDYDISEPESRFSRQPYGGKRHPGLVGASNSYWYNPAERFFQQDAEDYRRNIYSTPNRHSNDFNENYRNLPYGYPNTQKENSDSRDQTVNGNVARQPKYDYIERPQRRGPNEARYREIAKEITSFTVLNRMAYNLLASTNFSTPNQNTRNSTEFKFTMAILDGTLEYLESELKEVEEMSDYDTFKLYKSMPDRLSQLTDMTKKARSLISDSVEPSEYIKNQQLEGIFVMMDAVVKEIEKMTEILNIDHDDDDVSRMERLMLLDEYSRDYGECGNRWTLADEIAFLKKKLDQCMKLCSQCS